MFFEKESVILFCVFHVLCYSSVKSMESPLPAIEDLGFMKQRVQNELFKALRKNNAAAVIEALSYGADPNELDGDLPPLYRAARNCGLEAVRYLLSYKADVLKCSREGDTPLHAAAAKRNEKTKGNSVALIRELLAHGACINAINDNTKGTPLSYAVCNGNLEAVKVLLDSGADILSHDEGGESRPFHMSNLMRSALQTGQVSLVRELLVFGVQWKLSDCIMMKSVLSEPEWLVLFGTRDDLLGSIKVSDVQNRKSALALAAGRGDGCKVASLLSFAIPTDEALSYIKRILIRLDRMHAKISLIYQYQYIKELLATPHNSLKKG